MTPADWIILALVVPAVLIVVALALLGATLDRDRREEEDPPA